jgi:hypothetical protein
MSTKRPLNICHSCNYTFYPRGKDVSPQCPQCGGNHVGMQLPWFIRLIMFFLGFFFSKPKPSRTDSTLFPPEETVWEKYSSHFEFPLASATSIFLHGFVIGILAIGGLAFFFAASAEAMKPPTMDVVMVEGDGTGFEGGGGEPGLPGAPDAGGPKRTEIAPSLPDQPPPPDYVPPQSDDVPLPELGLPLFDDARPPVDRELFLELQRKLADAEKREKELKPNVPSNPAAGPKESKKPGPIGTGNPKGVGGLGGPGGGTGAGKKIGPGKGIGGPGGVRGTKQEIYARRWSFDLTGDGPEHARKLAAIGVNVGVIDPQGNFYFVTDMNRRPAELKRDKMPNLQEVVGWQNNRPESIGALARELKLSFVPRVVILLLPKEREVKMAEEEARFVAEQGRELSTVRRTWFDFRLRNGQYDPVGLRLE